MLPSHVRAGTGFLDINRRFVYLHVIINLVLCLFHVSLGMFPSKERNVGQGFFLVSYWSFAGDGGGILALVS